MSDYYDMHCHILFGVDDGPASIEDAQTMLRMEYESGVRTVYLTPHYRKNLFECPMDVRLNHYALLRGWAQTYLPGLTLYLGCELHVHMDMVNQLQSSPGLTLGDTDFVLLEFPASADRRQLIDHCHAVMSAGYRPVIAHAERCERLRTDLMLLQRLVHMGVFIQMNCSSIIGENGLRWKWFCKRAMHRGLLHFVGSDAHNLTNLKPNLEKCARYLEKTMGAEYRDQILTRNPREIIEGSV